VEAEGSLDWGKWNISVSGTWMRGTNRSPADGSNRYDGKALPNRPELSGTARLTRKFGRGSAFAEYRYTGENYVDTMETALFNARGVYSLGVKYDISPAATLALGVDDVFNDADGWRMHPEQGLNGPTRVLWYPVEGRSYYMTLDMRF